MRPEASEQTMARPLVMSSLDIRNLTRANDAIQRGRPGARTAATRMLAGMVLARVVREARARARDTGRYARGYGMAYNMVAEPPLQPQPLTAITKGRFVEVAQRQLAGRISWYEAVDRDLSAWITAQERRPGGAGWPSVKRARKKLEKVRRNLGFAREQLATATSPDGAYAAVVLGRRVTSKTVHLKSGVARLLLQIYGGDAVVLNLGTDQTLVKITHREPHAAIVEKRVGLMRETINMARRIGVRTVARKHVTEIEKVLLVRGLPGATRVHAPAPDGRL